MPSKSRTSDPDNPEWTVGDFARARYGENVPAAVREAFGKERSRSVTAVVARQGVGFSRAALAA